jgi:hypothetical protein
MSDDRISRIQKSTNNEQLDKAMDGFALESNANHPALQTNAGFASSMSAGQFLHALGHVRRARLTDDDKYLDVIRVLEFASTRELAIKMF